MRAGAGIGRVALALAALAGVATAGSAADAPAPALTPKAVLQAMERVADWQLAHPSSDDPLRWTQAAGYAGMMALAGVSKSPRFEDAMRRMGETNGWQLGKRPYDADDHCVGQTYAELFLQHRDPAMIAPLRERFDWILAHPKDDNLDFDETRNPDRRDRWSWCDSLFMAPPAWLRLFAATGNARYLDFAIRKWWVTSDFLYDPKEHLFFRDSTFFEKRETNGSKIFWSRGNGWVMAGLARVLEHLPPDHPSRGRFVRQYEEMAARIVELQQPDGLWRASLLDPESYPLKETSGSAFYCYALAWGVNRGLLERARFEPGVRRAWLGLVDCVDEDGKLTHVQPVGSDPRRFDQTSTAPYGVGGFLLAGSEVFRLLSQR
jgi:rhamnogalacturonyl hydrolase YesR